MGSDNTATHQYWQCTDCRELNSPDVVTCRGCGETIPTHWGTEDDHE